MMDKKYGELIPTPGLELNRKDYATNLQYRRALKSLTQAELAKRADVNLRTLQDYEQGRKPISGARVETVIRLAAALGCMVDDLMDTPSPEKRIKKIRK